MAQKRRRRAPRTSARRLPRWLVLVGVLALSAGAIYVLGRGGRGPLPGEIGAASRAKLERVLEREDRGTHP